MLQQCKLSALVSTLEASRALMDSVLTEYEAHDETYCRDYKVLMKRWLWLESKYQRMCRKIAKIQAKLDQKMR